MTATSFSRIAALIFTIVALLQLIRAYSGWDITVGTTAVPVLASWIAAAVAALLAWMGFTARE